VHACACLYTSYPAAYTSWQSATRSARCWRCVLKTMHASERRRLEGKPQQKATYREQSSKQKMQSP
jgi:hypothetical protein